MCDISWLWTAFIFTGTREKLAALVNDPGNCRPRKYEIRFLFFAVNFVLEDG
ncbi:hypothetical protein NC653_029677 [Populus alba x Populus x berolinensis]|uniref:Uncharacterized protein n=1 Tax=Populus alba x Populus x berolinensis TaxID=444605 RepID=A0AAD6M2M6_9ROSI|nr:hypothetical protein NC653_029677 [Populus alba x Populus x berolinensis]